MTKLRAQICVIDGSMESGFGLKYNSLPRSIATVQEASPLADSLFCSPCRNAMANDSGVSRAAVIRETGPEAKRNLPMSSGAWWLSFGWTCANSALPYIAPPVSFAPEPSSTCSEKRIATRDLEAGTKCIAWAWCRAKALVGLNVTLSVPGSRWATSNMPVPPRFWSRKAIARLVPGASLSSSTNTGENACDSLLKGIGVLHVTFVCSALPSIR
mmetsp:Transcript_79325/g.220637  ORF Transcript_79325/g.220637 Transcript_79325/m.220637 type:complete len:214 (+) Transcript_79325:554-1195(+)